MNSRYGGAFGRDIGGILCFFVMEAVKVDGFAETMHGT